MLISPEALFLPISVLLTYGRRRISSCGGVIGCGLTLLLPSKALKMFGLNGLIILMTIYFFEGIAIVSFYFEKKEFSRILRLFLYTLIVLQQIILFLIIGIGFLIHG